MKKPGIAVVVNGNC